MERALEGDQAGSPRGVAGELDGALHRFGAAVREEDLVEVAGRERGDPFRQFDRRLVMGNDGDVHQLVELFMGRLDHLRVAVAQGGDADAGREIQIAATIDWEEIGSIGTIDVARRAFSSRRGGSLWFWRDSSVVATAWWLVLYS